MPNDTRQPDPSPALDLRVAQAAERVTMLHDLADLGMSLTRATVRHAIESMEAPEADGAAAPRNDPAEIFAKLSRAVRLTITLEAKLDDALVARLAGEIPKPEKPRASGAARSARDAAAKDDAANDDISEDENFYAELKTGKKGRVRELMVDVIDREIPDPHDCDDIIDALEERLMLDEAYANLDDLPLRDIVERLCADLKLKPDWKRWTGEGWTPNPPFWRPRCSYFTQPSRTCLLTDDPEPDRRV